MKKVTVLLALLLCIGMISCDDNADKPATTGTTMNTEASSIETYETTTAENIETTVMTTVDTTGTDTKKQTPSLPEFDINAPECLPYRLLNMTVAEIEAEFGEMKYEYAIGGAGPCYSIDKYNIIMYYSSKDAFCDEPLPESSMPRGVEIYDKNVDIYPGLIIGEDTEEIIGFLGADNMFLNASIPFKSSSLSYGEFAYNNVKCSVNIGISIPDEVYDEIYQIGYDENGNRTDKYDEAILKTYKQLQNGLIDSKVEYFIILK